MNYGSADSVEIDDDEGRWLIRIVTTDGETYTFGIHGVAFEFAGSQGLRDLLEWRGEGESVRVERRLHLIDDRERDDGYTLDDPKHPDYHDVMSGLADDR